MLRTRKPDWYATLMRQSFHQICSDHPTNVLDFFCFFCLSAVCCKCKNVHCSRHPIIQVFDLIEHDAVWLDCISEFLHCSRIQTFDFQGRKVVLLKPKQQMPSSGRCPILVQRPFKFCCVACKVNYVSNHVGDLNRVLKIESFAVRLSVVNPHFAPDPPERVVGSEGPTNPKPSLFQPPPEGYDDRNDLVECLGPQPPPARTSQGLTLPAVGSNDKIAPIEGSIETIGGDGEPQRFEAYNAGEPSLSSGSEWLPEEQNYQNVPNVPFCGELTAEDLKYFDSEPAEEE